MRVFLAAIFSSVVLSAYSASAEPSKTAGQTADGPVLAELFTSQGCSSCPPAESYFEDLVDKGDVAVIVWHVDVWDTLVHHGSSWKDPHSDPAFTMRLRQYNKVIRGTPQVYTPQAIIGGEVSVIGSRTGEVDAAILSAKPPAVEVIIEDGAATVTGGSEGEVIFVRLLKEHTTDVTGGENKGRQLSGRNIALQGLVLGEWTGEAVRYGIPELDEGETCAVIVQERRAGRVLGTGMCG